MREIAATILVGLLGAIALTVAFVVPLMLLRSIVRYHLETEGLRVTLLSYTLWYARRVRLGDPSSELHAQIGHETARPWSADQETTRLGCGSQPR
ncbi:MAG: hypothetical protein E6J84_07005 [Deltaproteobacteria bacterium]|nr:MAG: hypothetical protein E6J84_07005 [Deltaproteobacteria bacterium]